jgi:hypothetical protein
MPTLAALVASYTRTPAWSVLLGGQPWRAIVSLRTSQAFGSGISTATIVGRDPPVAPAIGTTVSFRWGFAGAALVPGFTGEIARPARKSYPNRYTIECRDVLWRADRSQQVIVTDPLNSITASDAVRYILTHYGGISSSRISLPTFSASGSEWGGSEWTLGILTPVQWGDTDTNSGGTTALKAAQEICSVLGYWLYADASGIIRAKQMERAPSLSAAHTFQRGVDLLTNGSPELVEDVDAVKNRIIVRGGNTGIDGAQIMDAYQTSHPVLPSGVYQEDTFSSFLIEYVNATQAGAASATEVAKRILKVKSRLPVVVRHRVKADPRLAVGATVGIIDSAIGYTTARNFFIYELETSLDCVTGDFSQQMTLDGGTGNSGYTTIPPPDASFSWLLMTETLDGDAVVEVALDGSGSTSLTEGEIVDWDWSTSMTTYGSTPNTATGVKVVFFFLQSAGTAEITLTVTDTTSKTGTLTQTIDLTGADTQAPFREVVGAAAGAAWYVTPDGGASWNIETSNGAAIAVSTIGAGGDDRAPGTAGTYGMLATRGALGAGGLRRTLDTLASASTNLVSNAAAITSNIWQNEANPARVWFAIGTAVYRSTDGGATKTAMAVAAASVKWIMEDPAVDNSIFLLAGANMYNATDPTVGYALLYAGPVGATARQFVRSRDGQVTWICYSGAPSGEALQRVETGAFADIAVDEIRTLALDREATSALATLYAITADDPAQLWSFDGLTGLSAAASSQTFAAGATVQHMLSSRQFDVLYTADFDSVAAGTGSLMKYFPSADLLLLWKELATGQQGHMLGLGARAASPAEFLRMTISVDPGGVWHYKDSVWTFRPLPVSGTVRGIAVVADPFNASRWLAIFNNTDHGCYDSSGVIHGNGWAHSPLWETNDAGVTWTEVVITTPGGWVDASILVNVSFNDQVGNSWAAVFANGGSFYTAVVLGSSATVTTIVEGSTTSAPGIVGGADAEWLLVVTFSSGVDGLRYLDTSNVFQTPAGSQPADLSFASVDRLPGTSRAAFIALNSVYATTDYRAAQPTSLLAAGGNAQAVSAGSAALYYYQADADVWRVVDPFGAATQTQIVAGIAETYPRVDRQTRTVCAIGVGGAIYIDNGTTTTTIAGPTGSLSRTVDGAPYAIEVMVRP